MSDTAITTLKLRDALPLASFLPTATAALLSKTLGLDSETAIIIVTIVSLATVSILWAVKKLRERRRSTAERVSVALAGGVSNPMLVLTLFALGLLAVEFLIGFVIAVAGGEAVFEDGGASGLVLAINLSMLLIIVPMAIIASHRLRSRPVSWLLGGIGVYVIVSAIIGLLIYPWEAGDMRWIAIVVVGRFAFFGAAALLGHWLAHRTRDRVAIYDLFKALPSDDRHALIELLQEDIARLAPTGQSTMSKQDTVAANMVSSSGKTCAGCGGPVDEGDSFCTRCGLDVGSSRSLS